MLCVLLRGIVSGSSRRTLSRQTRLNSCAYRHHETSVFLSMLSSWCAWCYLKSLNLRNIASARQFWRWHKKQTLFSACTDKQIACVLFCKFVFWLPTGGHTIEWTVLHFVSLNLTLGWVSFVFACCFLWLEWVQRIWHFNRFWCLFHSEKGELIFGTFCQVSEFRFIAGKEKCTNYLRINMWRSAWEFFFPVYTYTYDMTLCRDLRLHSIDYKIKWSEHKKTK